MESGEYVGENSCESENVGGRDIFQIFGSKVYLARYQTSLSKASRYIYPFLPT